MTTIEKYPISGQVAAGFEPVRAAFENNFDSLGTQGVHPYVVME